VDEAAEEVVLLDTTSALRMKADSGGEAGRGD